MNPIKTIGIVGAGTMGNGIAQACATNGYEVIMLDVSQDAVDRGLSAIDNSLDRLTKKGKLQPAEKARSLAAIKGSIDYKDLRGAQLVVEAATESEALKIQILQQLDALLDANAVMPPSTVASRDGFGRMARAQDRARSLSILSSLRRVRVRWRCADFRKNDIPHRQDNSLMAEDNRTMKVLIVFAHPESQSFSAALKDAAVQKLESLGHEVNVSDLYKMAWNPALSASDFGADRVNPDYLDLSAEQEAAHAKGSICDAVRLEQSKLAEADMVLFHFPVWWFSMPAMLKGWVDRVFSRGFAYSTGKKYETGHFKGKKAMLCITTGTASTLYEPNGIDGDLMHVLWPIHNGMLGYTGFTVFPPYAAWMPARVSAEDRAQYLAEYQDRLQAVLDAKVEPLFFHPWNDYDQTQRLKPGVVARSGVQWNPKAGQSFEEAAKKSTPKVTDVS